MVFKAGLLPPDSRSLVSNISIDGNQFVINGVRRPYRFATSFCLLGHYQQGRRLAGREWLHRLKALGFDGPRLFGETEDWFAEPGDFFGDPKYTSEVVAFGRQAQTGWSQMQLVPGYRESVEQLLEDLLELDMVGEFVCSATVKGRDESVTSHGLNRWAQMFREILGTNPNGYPVLFETVNEWNAHSSLSQSEVERYGARWRRSNPNDPGHHNFPGSLVGVSAGGSLQPGLRDTEYTHRNLHPPRGEYWHDTPFRSLLLDNKPVALNETIHLLSEQQADYWYPKIPKWANLSTTDTDQALKYYKAAVDTGLSICVHYFEGMSTNPDAPVSEIENAFAKEFGGQAPVIPARIAYKNVIELAYQQLLDRKPDVDGLKAHSKLMSEDKGYTESVMRQTLIRSDEYQAKYGPLPEEP